ncbi:MAG TPA: hypothetical protein VFZ45_04835 [Actinomycetota bacterium]|nr:hypothetical protein [Actinomycetota bacterium]
MAQPQRPGGFDMARMTTGSKVVLVTAILLFIDLFFPWQGVDFGDFLGTDLGSANVSGFNGLGVLVAILCIAVIVWEGMLAAGVTINTGASSPALIGAALAAATALVTIIAFLTKLDAIKWGAFVGLILALVMTYGAYLRFQESRAGGMSPPPAA